MVFAPAKHRQHISASPAAVTVITRKDIIESGATSLIDFLRRYPELHVYEFDPLYPSVMARATIRVLLRIDGREANTEFYPAPFYEIIPVGLDDIERIEIVMGPNSSLYGANAVSAVIDITTRRPNKQLAVEAEAAGGEHGQLRTGLRAEGGLGPVLAQGTFRLDRAGSWMEEGRLVKDLLRAFFFSSLQVGNVVLQADAGAVHGSGQIYGVLGNMDFDSIVMANAGLLARAGSWKARLWWNGLRTVFLVDLDMVHPLVGELARLPWFHLSGDTFHGEVQYDHSFWGDRLLLIAGLDGRTSWYRSQQLVRENLYESRAGFFLHLEWQALEWLRLTFGGRFDYNTVTHPAFSPRGAAVFNWGTGHTLRLSAGTAFRKPTMIETGGDFRIEPNPAFADAMRYLFEEKGISNPDLDNEVLTGLELGYRRTFFGEKLKLAADIYFNINRNWVNFVSDIRFRPPPFQMQIDLENSFLGYVNSGADYDLLGVHAAAEFEPADWLSLFLRGEWRHEWSESESPPLTVLWQVAAGGTCRLTTQTTFHLAVLQLAGRHDYVRDPTSSLLPNIWLELEPVTWLMLSLRRRFELPAGSMEVGLTLNNPFGNRFREKAGIVDQLGHNYGGELLGRLLMLSLNMRI